MKGWSARAAGITGAVLLLLLCAAALVSGLILREHQIEDWRQHLGALSQVLAESTAQTMTSSYMVLDGVTALAQEALDRGVNAAPDAQLRRLMKERVFGLPQVDVASVLAADGGLRYFTRAFPAPAINLAQRDYFRFHREHGGAAVFVSAPVQDSADGRWRFYLSRRLNGPGGVFAGVAVVGLSCDFFSEFFRNVSLGEHAAVSLYRADQTLLARWPQADAMMGRRVTGGATFDVISRGQQHGVVRLAGPRMADGGKPVARMGAVRVVRDYPFIVNVTITENMLLARWRDNAWLLGCVVLASLLVLTLAFWLMVQLLRRREQDAQRALALQRQADAHSAAKSRFLAVMSHEIRTPMNSIAGLSALMLDGPLEPVQRSYASTVHQGMLELTHTINEVLDFSKVEAGRMELDLAPFSPLAQLRQVLALHRAAALQKGLLLVLRPDNGADNGDGAAAEAGACAGSAATGEAGQGTASPPWLMGDAARLRQVIGNLLSNAIKFTAAGSVTLGCSARPDGAYWRLRLTVSDTGIGIDAQARQRLFQPFSQADSTISHQYGGTGLGLAICYRLVELMGGEIGCASTPGQGSTFHVELPCAAAAPPAMPPASSPPQPQPQSGAAAASATTGPGMTPATASTLTRAAPPITPATPAAPLRVLLADDVAMNRQLARILLERSGCSVDEACDGQQALEALARTGYDLVLMDCMMPLLDGFEATRRLRAREAAGGVPSSVGRTVVIALTAGAIDGDRERCLAAGMDDYLSKPFTAQQFADLVARWRPAPGRLPE